MRLKEGVVSGTIVWAKPADNSGMDGFEIWFGAWSSGHVTRITHVGDAVAGTSRYRINEAVLPTDASHVCLVPKLTEKVPDDDLENAVTCVVLRLRTSDNLAGAEEILTSTPPTMTEGGAEMRIPMTIGLQKAGDFRDHPAGTFSDLPNYHSRIKVLAANCGNELPFQNGSLFHDMTCAAIMTQAYLCKDPIAKGSSTLFENICPCTCGVCRSDEAVACVNRWVSRGCQQESSGTPRSNWPTEQQCLNRFPGCTLVAKAHDRCNSQCENGFYQTVVDDSVTCARCPRFSNSPANSTGIFSCVCGQGKFQTNENGVTCTMCPPNTFSNILGGNTCVGCPANSKSPEGSVYPHHCLCDPGYYQDGSQCIACQPGSYKGSAGPDACSTCPANATNAAASVDVTSCVCVTGHAGVITTTSDFCEECQSGFYATRDRCERCPAHTDSFARAPNVFQCYCARGYMPIHADDAKEPTCAPCWYGYYKTDISNNACVPCPSRLMTRWQLAADTIDLCIPLPEVPIYPSPTPQPSAASPVYPTYPFMDPIRPPSPPRQYYLAPGYYPPQFYPAHYMAYPGHQVVPALNTAGMMM